MLATTPHINQLSGYQYQRTASPLDTSNSIAAKQDPSNTQKDNTQKDKVTLSQKAINLQQVYAKKETVLEQGYASDTNRLESQFIQAKNQLEQEHSQKNRP
jgi:hypothetical protein